MPPPARSYCPDCETDRTFRYYRTGAGVRVGVRVVRGVYLSTGSSPGGLFCPTCGLSLREARARTEELERAERRAARRVGRQTAYEAFESWLAARAERAGITPLSKRTPKQRLVLAIQIFFGLVLLLAVLAVATVHPEARNP